MHQEFPKLEQLTQLITTYVKEQQQTHTFPVAEFRQELLAVFADTDVHVKWVYEQEPPLMMLVKHVRDTLHIHNSPYLETLTNTYVETLRLCLSNKPLTQKRKQSTESSQVTTPPDNTLDDTLQPFAHPAEKLVAKTQAQEPLSHKKKQSSHESTQTDTLVTPLRTPVSKKNQETLASDDKQFLQSLLNTLRERSLPVVMWSQVDSIEKVQEVMCRYLQEIDYLTHLIDTLCASKIPQVHSYLTKFLSYKDDITEVTQWMSQQMPISFRADEQIPSKRYAKKSIQIIRGGIDAILVSLLPENK